MTLSGGRSAYKSCFEFYVRSKEEEESFKPVSHLRSKLLWHCVSLRAIQEPSSTLHPVRMVPILPSTSQFLSSNGLSIEPVYGNKNEFYARILRVGMRIHATPGPVVQPSALGFILPTSRSWQPVAARRR